MPEETGMPGVPGALEESVSGSTSFVHDLPPPVFSTNCTAGRSTESFMPLTSLDMTDVFTVLFVGSTTPPPQLFVRLSESSLRLAAADAGPSAARRAASFARAALPFTEPLILIALRVLRYAERSLTAVHGDFDATVRA